MTDMSNPSMSSESYSLSYFEHSLNWYFSIHSHGRYMINGDGSKDGLVQMCLFQDVLKK